MSRFFANFGGEEVVVRPTGRDAAAFKIEVLLQSNKATFPPAADVQEGDIVERVDPRGGVVSYEIKTYDFNKDPFGRGNDHWEAVLVELSRAERQRRAAQLAPSIVVNGGTNQIAVGDQNRLQQQNAKTGAELAHLLDQLARSMPKSDLDPNTVAELDDAFCEARAIVEAGASSAKVKRSLYGLRGLVEEVGQSAEAGVGVGIKTWVSATVATLLQQVAGF